MRPEVAGLSVTPCVPVL